MNGFTLRMALRFTAWLQERADRRAKERAERNQPRGNLIIFTNGRKVEMWGVDPDPTISVDDHWASGSYGNPDFDHVAAAKADEPIPYELAPKPKQPWEPDGYNYGPCYFVKRHMCGLKEVIHAHLSEDWMASQGWLATDDPFPMRDKKGERWIANSLGDVTYRHTFLGHPIEWDSNPDKPVKLRSLGMRAGRLHVERPVEQDPKYPGFGRAWWMEYDLGGKRFDPWTRFGVMDREQLLANGINPDPIDDANEVRDPRNVWEEYAGTDIFGPYWAINGTFTRSKFMASYHRDRAERGLYPKPVGVA